MGKWAPSPKEEPTIIPEDPASILNHREWVSRQKQIQIAKAQLVREKLRDCYIKEGVNHIQKCRKVRGCSCAPHCSIAQNSCLDC
eukprot:jgi/Astpho2/7529/e_gw1.00114.202.1_t